MALLRTLLALSLVICASAFAPAKHAITKPSRYVESVAPSSYWTMAFLFDAFRLRVRDMSDNGSFRYITFKVLLIHIRLYV